MGYSLLSLGANTRKQALAGLKSSAQHEEQREQANDNLDAAEKAQTMSSAGMGAATGAMIGMQYGSVGGPIGAGIGMAAGLVLGELF